MQRRKFFEMLGLGTIGAVATTVAGRMVPGSEVRRVPPVVKDELWVHQYNNDPTPTYWDKDLIKDAYPNWMHHWPTTKRSVTATEISVRQKMINDDMRSFTEGAMRSIAKATARQIDQHIMNSIGVKA